MILGVGIDICDVVRISGVVRRSGSNFLERVFTETERAAAATCEKPNEFYARQFAGKEACAKALSTGITDRVSWLDIAVSRTNEGQFGLILTGGALARLKRLTPKDHMAVLHLSLSDIWPLASAVVIIEARLRI